MDEEVGTPFSRARKSLEREKASARIQLIEDDQRTSELWEGLLNYIAETSPHFEIVQGMEGMQKASSSVTSIN